MRKDLEVAVRRAPRGDSIEKKNLEDERQAERRYKQQMDDWLEKIETHFGLFFLSLRMKSFSEGEGE